MSDLLYFEVCCEHIERFDEAVAQLEELAADKKSAAYESPEYYSVMEQEIPLDRIKDHSGAIVVVFAAMCLESLIYDFGARHTSDSYFKKYLDKLDPVAKWVVVTKLVAGESIDTESHAFQFLKKLFTSRNSLVHSKSKRVPADHDDLVKYLKAHEESFPSQVRDSVRAVFAVTAELGRVAPGSPAVAFYDPESDRYDAVRQYA